MAEEKTYVCKDCESTKVNNLVYSVPSQGEGSTPVIHVFETMSALFEPDVFGKAYVVEIYCGCKAGTALGFMVKNEENQEIEGPFYVLHQSVVEEVPVIIPEEILPSS